MICLVVMSVTTDVATPWVSEAPCSTRQTLLGFLSGWGWLGSSGSGQPSPSPDLANEKLARASILGGLDPCWKTKLAQMIVLQDIDSLPCET